MNEYVVLNELGDKLLFDNPWNDGETLVCDMSDEFTIFPSEEAARAAIAISIAYEERNGLNWHTESWKVVPFVE